MLQTTYRSSDNPPTSKAELLNEYCSSESVPSEPFCHPIECDPKENPFNVQYVRGSAVPSGDNQMLYDLGSTFIATSGQQGTNTLGDLWVTYEIELKKPLLSSNVTSGATFGSLYCAGAPTNTNIFPVAGVSTGTLPISVSTNTLTIPTGTIGSYIVAINIEAATSFTSTDMGLMPTLVNATAAALNSNANTYFRSVVVGGAANRAFHICGFTVTNPSLPATLTYTVPSLFGTAVSTSVDVSRIL